MNGLIRFESPSVGFRTSHSMNVWRAFVAALLCGLIASCGGLRSVVPDKTTLAQVRATSGNPTDIRFDSDGDELWEYGGGILGTETFLVRAGNNGVVKSVTQLRSQQQFDKIQAGQSTKADVRRLLGLPSDESFLYNGTSWSWRAQLAPQRVLLVVHFDANDVVASKIIVSDDIGDGGDRDQGGGK